MYVYLHVLTMYGTRTYHYTKIYVTVYIQLHVYIYIYLYSCIDMCVCKRCLCALHFSSRKQYALRSFQLN